MSKAEVAAGALPVLIVTCAKSPPERLTSAQAQLADFGAMVAPQVVMGVVADDPQIDTLYDPARNRRRLKRPLTRTEIAIYASHRTAWQALLDSGAPAALVLEDDFRIRDATTVRRALTHWPALLAGGRDIVKLFDFEKRRRCPAAATVQVADLPLACWASPTAGMVAYLITLDGARKFLARPRIYRQVDEDTKYFWELGLNIWSIPGSPIVDNSAALGGSLVEQERRARRRRSLARSLWGNLLTLDRKARTRWHLRHLR